MSFTDVRSVHVKGHIAVCTDRSKTSDKFLTCGSEGTVYVWDEKCIAERLMAEVKNVGDATHSCCAWNGKNVFVGLTTTDLLTGVDKRIVGHCLLEDLESCRQLFTFSLEVTCIDASVNYVVAGGSDFTVKKVNLKDSSQYGRIDTDGEVLSVAIDPKEEVYAVACCDGTISIFDISSNDKISTLEDMYAAFSDIGVWNPRHSLTWSENGSELFVPSQGSVKVIARNSWSQLTNSFKSSDSSTDVFSTSCLSNCGRYLCSSTLSNKILFWSVADRKLVSQYDYKRDSKAIISCIKFVPSCRNDVIITDVNEGLCILRDAVQSTSFTVSFFTEPKKDDDKYNCDKEEGEIDKESLGGNFLDNEAEDDEETRMSADIGAIKKRYGFGDDGTNKLEDYGFALLDEPFNKGLVRHQDTQPISASVVAPPQVVEYQPPAIPSFFVSGASPDNLTHRYLKWNSYGTVRSYAAEDVNSIEVTFHDTSIHPTFVLDNGTTDYVLADLSDQAVALASKAEEKGEQSELLVIHFATWDNESRRWTTKLPRKESALDVLVTREIVCLVTDKRYLRIFTLSGTQRQIISHPSWFTDIYCFFMNNTSPILTTACFESRVAVCSVLGGDFYEKAKDQRPSFHHILSEYNVDGKLWYRKNESCVDRVDLPVARKEQLLWLAYTNHGQLVSMDSSYTIHLLTTNGFWVPIFDGGAETTSKSDAIWPIAVTQGRQRQIRYLYCKGSKYPLMALKMIPLLSPWTLPYCAPESDKSKLEQELLLNELQQSEARHSGDFAYIAELASSHLQTLIKLYALACKSERDGRAAELAGFVTNAKGIQMMCNYAAKLKKSTLAEKVAAQGRENISSIEPAYHDALVDAVDQDPVPRRLFIKKKTDSKQQSVFVEGNNSEGSTAAICNFEDDDEENGITPESTHSQKADETLLNETVIPVRRFSKNPFKRSPTSSIDTASIFDVDTSFSISRKRPKGEELPLKSTSKQQKLMLGDSSHGKENARTAYTLWMECNEGKLRGMFSGNPEDFVKFCAQQFRLLPPKEKKEWKDLAGSSQ